MQSFRERVQALGKTDPLAARVLLLQDTKAYVTGEGAGPAPVVPEAARVELGVDVFNQHVATKTTKAVASALKELGLGESMDAAKVKLGLVAPPVAPAAPATPAPAAPPGAAQ